MNFLERLLQGIQGKTQAEQLARAQTLIAEQAKLRTSESAEERWTRDFFEGRELERKVVEERLKRYSVRERLEAVRGGVWKVGEVKPIKGLPMGYILDSHKDDPNFKHPKHVIPVTGYYLTYSYPAAVPIYQGYTSSRRASPAEGGSDIEVHTIDTSGYFTEGIRTDAVAISVEHGIYFEAISRYSGELTDRDIGRLNDLHHMHDVDTWYIFKHFGAADSGKAPVDSNGNLGNFAVGIYEHRYEPWLYITPDDLEKLTINYSHFLTTDTGDFWWDKGFNRLPLQSQAAMQRKLVAARRDGRIR